MCLYITSKKLKRLRKDENGKITLYKKVVVRDGVIETPFQGTEINSGWFKAMGETTQAELSRGVIYGGAIHVYTNKKIALKSKYEYQYIIKCWAYAKDLVAEGEFSEAAFSKIFIPASEYKKVVKCINK